MWLFGLVLILLGFFWILEGLVFLGILAIVVGVMLGGTSFTNYRF